MHAATQTQIDAINSLNLDEVCESDRYELIESIIGIDSEPAPAPLLPVVHYTQAKH